MIVNRDLFTCEMPANVSALLERFEAVPVATNSSVGVRLAKAASLVKIEGWFTTCKDCNVNDIDGNNQL